MSPRFEIEWHACTPFGERAVLVNTFATSKANRYPEVLGFVWQKLRRWCAQDAAGRFLGWFRTQEQARNRVTLGKVLNGSPVLVRAKG